MIIDDHSKEENLSRIKELINKNNIEVISLDHKKFETKNKKTKNKRNFF